MNQHYSHRHHEKRLKTQNDQGFHPPFKNPTRGGLFNPTQLGSGGNKGAYFNPRFPLLPTPSLATGPYQFMKHPPHQRVGLIMDSPTPQFFPSQAYPQGTPQHFGSPFQNMYFPNFPRMGAPNMMSPVWTPFPSGRPRSIPVRPMVAQPINSPNLGPDRNRIQTSDHTKTKSFQVNQTTQTNQANQPKVAPPTTTTEKANIPSNVNPKQCMMNSGKKIIFISNLSPNTTKDQLTTLFSSTGQIQSLDLDATQGKAVVRYRSFDAALAAKRKFDRTVVDGKHIQIAFEN